MSESRVLFIPDGLEGERVDAAVARMMGLSRSRITDLIGRGQVLIDGGTASKSDRVTAGAVLEVTLDDEAPALDIVPQAVDGLNVVYVDDDIVVIDKPVGVAAHPGVGWTGPSVLGHLAAAGHRISTSGVPERKGIVQRLDVGTSGLMVVAKSEQAYTVLKRAFKSRTVDKTYHTLVQGHPDPFTGTIEAPIGRHPGADYKMAVIAGGRHSVTHYDTLTPSSAPRCSRSSWRPAGLHQIRVHMAAIRHPCVGDPTYGAIPCWRPGSGWSASGCTRCGSASPTRDRREQVTFSSPYPDDLQHALDVVARLRRTAQLDAGRSDRTQGLIASLVSRRA